MARVKFHPILEVPDDASKAIPFFFEGQSFTARPGEMIASALFAHGIRTFGLHPADQTPQGLFCANGQCAQCLIIANGHAVKACMTPVRTGMRIHKLVNLPQAPLLAREAIAFTDIEQRSCDLLIIGAGPAGLGAAIEAADAGLVVVLADDKDRLGGKLVLQTHQFFGSVDECFAGTRGMNIAALLAAEVAKRPSIQTMTSTTAVGIYSDGKVGLVENNSRYLLVAPRSLLVATGAREKALFFPGCELPGVYGAGAFQTLLNRDLVKPSERLFIVGGGNVGLIAAYHALQAGIQVVGLIEGLPEVGGYWVHADKIRRFGVPIHTGTTVVCANGRDALESVTVAGVDARWNIKPETCRTYACDTLLLAVGLESVNELYKAARRFDFDVHTAGDAEDIAEASAAMFSGRLAGRQIARKQGRPVEVPARWQEMIKILKSKPGRENLTITGAPIGAEVFPIIRCLETIPCNPCAMVCPLGGIKMPKEGDILPRAEVIGPCRACGKCVAACPGLAITLVDLRGQAGGRSLVTMPFDFPARLKIGDLLPVVGQKGEALGNGKVVRVLEKSARAPCSAACPAGVRAQGYIELIRKRKFGQAANLLREDLPLAGVCGRVCYHPCEENCARADVDEPVSVLALKRFVTDWCMARNEPIRPVPVTRQERVAVVGSGPSGLACANELLNRGYAVTVFESAPLAGGILRYGIPAYRLPDRILDWDLRCLQERGVKILTGRRVKSIRELLPTDYQSVYLATGAPLAARLGVPGEDLENVIGALAFLRNANADLPLKLSGSVAVIGGGNSALDTARVALRLGAQEVRVVYRRSRAEMPAHAEEIADAETEGVVFEFLSAPVRIEGENGKVARLVCNRMKLGEPDASGRRRPVPIAGTEFSIAVEFVIPAVGQAADLRELAAEIEVGRSKTILIDPVTQATNVPGVFAGGDVVTGPATVVDGFGAGKRAAESIDRHLRGIDLSHGRRPGMPASSKSMAPEGAVRQPRSNPGILAPKERAAGFAEIVATFTEDAAVQEAERCLGCGVYCENLLSATHNIPCAYEHTVLVTLEVAAGVATRVAGVRVQDEAVSNPISTVLPPKSDDDVVVCRCERVTLGQIRNAIRAGVRDMNLLKAMFKVGLGACGGKTCGPLIRSIFRREGVPASEITDFTERPLTTEVPLGLFAGVQSNSGQGEQA